jgi:NitT/TauT family transport system permease protein
VSDLAAVFIIFVAVFWPVVLSTMNAVRNVPLVHLQAARNFGLSPAQMMWRVVLPSTFGQLVVGLRLALGIAWLVDVAAEMIAVTSGLGFLIIDARNAGNRYDRVVAGMVMIGVVGFGLDTLMRHLQHRLTTGAVPQARPLSQAVNARSFLR